MERMNRVGRASLKKGPKNKWKVLFFLSLSFIGLCILTFVIGFFILFPAAEKSTPLSVSNVNHGEKIFTITTSKEQLNRFLKDQLDQEQAKTGMKYEITFDDKINIDGRMNMLGRQVPLTASFTPEVRKNGDLMLYVDEMSIAHLSLPKDRVLQTIKNNNKVPEWVKIQPADEQLLLEISQIPTQDHYKVKVKNFDLKQDQFAFEVYQ